MKKIIIVTFMLCSLLIACKSTQNTASTVSADPSDLNGTWELNYITGPKIAFDGLYPDKKPVITFNVTDGKINGNTSCNTFIGSLSVSGNNIDFTDPLAVSRMACPGEGESTFLDTLKKIETYSISGKTLTFRMGEVEMMRFTKK